MAHNIDQGEERSEQYSSERIGSFALSCDVLGTCDEVRALLDPIAPTHMERTLKGPVRQDPMFGGLFHGDVGMPVHVSFAVSGATGTKAELIGTSTAHQNPCVL